MNSRALITMMALMLGLAALSGCSDNSNELQRLVCEVESVNGGVPLISAGLNAGGDRIPGTQDDFVPIDSVPVVFRARAYNASMNIPSDGVYSSFIITGYDLEWASNDPNAPANLTDFNITDGFASAQIRIEDDSFVSALVAPLEMKQQAWFQDLVNNPNSPAFTAWAALTFKGHVSGTDHMTEIPTGVMVNFIGVVVE